MSQKICNWMIAVGALITFVGLLFFPSAPMGANKEDNLLGAGMAVFSVGAVPMKKNFYFKAKYLTTAETDPTRLAVGAKRRRGNCDGCQQELAVVQCTMHKKALGIHCICNHYESQALL